jgi:methanogenic corrinoid protein MtbC1
MLGPLSESLALNQLELFLDYVKFAKIMLMSRGNSPEAIIESMMNIREVLSISLEGAMAELARDVLGIAIREFPAMADELPSHVEGGNEFDILAAEFLRMLLMEDRRAASALIHKAVKDGIELRRLYLSVFQPTQREVGRLWQLNRITVAQEHYCTAVTQMIMSELYPYVFQTQRTVGRMVGLCVSNELHEIGMRMVSDFFEFDGWDTSYLGANMPIPDVLQHLRASPTALLAISCTMTSHIHEVVELISSVRSRPEFKDLKVVVGGYPFSLVPSLWRVVGADGCASDADGAVRLAHELCNIPSQ